MVVKHRQKSSRKMGDYNRTGHRHRGAGNRGGVGKAGHGKRAKQKKSMYMIEGKVDYGHKGFTSKRKLVKALDIGYICEHADAICGKKADKYEINIRKLGFSKVLGSGTVDKKLVISNFDSMTQKAKDKVLKAGGAVVEK